MSETPVRVANRIAAALKQFQPIIEAAKSRDVNESDTVTIVTDMLAELFGYDKYADVTSEVSIRGSYCDLAVKVDGEVECLVEAKAAGMELKESHTKQAVDYAANQGVEWVVLTNAAIWKVYKVSFGKPVTQELVVDFDFLALDPKSPDDVGMLYLLAKEGFQKSVLQEFSEQREALSRFTVGAVLLSDTVLQVVRREVRRLSPGVKIDAEQIRSVISKEVIKRDVLEGDRADEARRKVARATAKVAKAKVTVAEEIAAEHAAIPPGPTNEEKTAAAAASSIQTPKP